MAQIQFKRILTHNGTLEEAIYNIKHRLVPALLPGEPLLCSYLEEGIKKYLFAVGIENDVTIIPAFESYDAVNNFLHKESGGNWDNISEDSDIKVEFQNGQVILKIKDELKQNTWNLI